jgi:hypothetical protein
MTSGSLYLLEPSGPVQRLLHLFNVAARDTLSYKKLDFKGLK